jgi:Fe-S-cluster containining protein
VSSDREEAAKALVVLRGRVDAHFDRAMDRSPGQMRCGEGCHQCCHVRLSVFWVEAEGVIRALARLAQTHPDLRARIRSQADDPAHADRCAMLVDGRCAIYEERPLICRSHGLPIAVEDDAGSYDVDWCELNYPSAAPPPESTLRLDALNRPLAVMARMFDEHGDRIELAALAGSPDA